MRLFAGRTGSTPDPQAVATGLARASDRRDQRLLERLELRLVPEEERFVDRDGFVEELELLIPPRPILDELKVLLERAKVQHLQSLPQTSFQEILLVVLEVDAGLLIDELP